MYSKTAIVYKSSFVSPPNSKTKDDYYYRLRSCDTNLTSNTPSNQYQRLKLIQNTVRVASSLYTMNLGALNAYTKPTINNVCWNQMSDRPVPSIQKTYVPTGTNNSLNNRHSSVTSSKPGCQSPGGVGCDIKHNSYDRYLNRLKGKAPLRRGVIPPTFGAPIPFNRSFPIYGGKITKTSIVNNCNCPIDSNIENDEKIYNNPLYYPEQNINCTDIFKVGDYAYATEGTSPYYVKSLITDFNTITQIYTVEFDDGTFEEKTCNQLKIYFPCECVAGENPNSI